MAHQAAADDTYFLFLVITHVCLDKLPELRGRSNVYFAVFANGRIHRGEMVMPALLWVAFWSSMMATAACFAEASQPPAPKQDDSSRGD
jgi:hypothetical protein